MMRIGLSINEPQAGPAPLQGLAEAAVEAAHDGFESIWIPHIFDLDALTAIASIAQTVNKPIEIATAVIPTHPRHPAALAQQAITAQLAARGRLTLGLGTSHRRLIETAYGYEFTPAASRMGEYLAILCPLLRGDDVDFDGEHYQANISLRFDHPPEVPLLLAAMGPRLLSLAGKYADGTILWMTGRRAIENHVAPLLHAAAADAGRPSPRIVCQLPVCVTDEPERLRDSARERFAGYESAPSYRSMLDLEGAADACDIAVVGDEAEVLGQVKELGSVGVTDFVAVQIGDVDDRARTRAALLSWS